MILQQDIVLVLHQLLHFLKSQFQILLLNQEVFYHHFISLTHVKIVITMILKIKYVKNVIK